MILYRWQGVSCNFGDELNTVLWPKLLPDFFDDNPSIRFLGIGSVLDRRHGPETIKLVAGSGYGGYEPRPRLDGRWIIHWVRGPRTAATLGLPGTLALGDPAALVPSVLGLRAAGGSGIGFMPHFESAARGAWHLAAERAGVRLIDPRGSPLDILAAIGHCKVLLSEALHGVIVADALRVPWVAIQPRVRVHRSKWADWAETIDMRLRFHGLPASTLAEWAGGLPLGSRHPGRQWMDRRIAAMASAHPLVLQSSEHLVVRAARALQLASRVAPQLSTDNALDRCQSRMLDAVQAIRRNPMHAAAQVAPRRSDLRTGADSAYHLKLIG